MKLQQGQIWKDGENHFRIVRLERLTVEYKTITDFVTREGTHHQVSKKEFCRLVKKATLVSPAEAAVARQTDRAKQPITGPEAEAPAAPPRRPADSA